MMPYERRAPKSVNLIDLNFTCVNVTTSFISLGKNKEKNGKMMTTSVFYFVKNVWEAVEVVSLATQFVTYAFVCCTSLTFVQRLKI